LDAGFLGGADLVGEHPDVERARGLVLVDVLAVGLVALHEVTGRPAEATPPAQPDHHFFRHDITMKRSRSASAHKLSLLTVP
jgi:hypothetical protein